MAVGLPERIGRYRVEAVIGTGGFATVYRAFDERLNATVAVKVLAENHSHDADVRERFLKEGQVLRRIDGSHVVTVHDLGETERGQPYLVLDHADRGNLSERVVTRRAGGWRPEVTDLLHVAEALGDALAAVHASHLVHRDVAPRNLLLRSARVAGTSPGCGIVDPDERLLLADLGLSKDLATASGLTAGGGTAGYTPPEQRTSVAKVNAAADIWAASALVVWLLLDRPPDDEGRWRQELALSPWPDGLGTTLARGLAWDPVERFDSAPAWFAAIRESLVPTTVMAPPPPVPGAEAPAVGPDGRPVPIQPGGSWGEEPTLPAPAGPNASPPGAWADAQGRGSRFGWLRWGAVLVLGVALGAAAALLVRGGDGDDPDPVQQTEELPDGRVRVEAADRGRSVAIVGPAEIEVGERAVFEAETTEVDSHVWFGPDGGVHTDEARLAVDAGSPGTAAVTLVGVADDGSFVVATHVLDVVES